VGDLPDPKPGPGEVLVKVGAAALNPIDLYVRAGTVAMPLSFPFISGADLAGRVEAVGPVRIGTGRRPVWGSNQDCWAARA
jgi:NADPH2:quinone reductase